MLTGLKSAYHNYNARLNSRQFYKRIKSELSMLKGFHLREFFITADAHRGIAIDRTFHKFVLIKIIEEVASYSILHCSDLKSVYFYRDGSAVNSSSNRFNSNKQSTHALLKIQALSPTFIKLETASKSHPSFILPFDSATEQTTQPTARPQHQPDYWFDLCRQIIHKSEEKSEAMKSRQQVMS